MTQPLPPETLEYERYVDGLRRSNAKLLEALKAIMQAKTDGNGETPELSHFLADKARVAIAYALGTALPRPVKTITIHVEGGMVADVTGIPEGYEVRVEDYDHSDDTQPTWDAEKGCHVTVYEGDR